MATQTQPGLLLIITTALRLYASDRCNGPDCKLTINRLIRDYGTFYVHPEPQAASINAMRALADERLCTDHVIPVREIMEVLMKKAKHAANQKAEISTDFVKKYLENHLIICKITMQEDEKLRNAKLWQSMPTGSINEDGMISDKWARYKHHEVGIKWKSLLT